MKPVTIGGAFVVLQMAKGHAGVMTGEAGAIVINEPGSKPAAAGAQRAWYPVPAR
jgi:hypothetical protein